MYIFLVVVMPVFELKFFSAFVILILSLAAGFYPFHQRSKGDRLRQFPAGEALASGVFLGAGLMHMLVSANAQFMHLHVTYPLASLIAGVMFLILLSLEHLSREIYEKVHREKLIDCTYSASEQHDCRGPKSLSIIAAMILSIHSLIAGTALGVSRSFGLSMMVFIAIVSHKWAASFALSVQLNKSSLSPRAAAILFVVFCLMAPLGIMIGQYLDHYKILNQYLYSTPVLMSLAAGTFLYLGTLHGLKRAVMVDKCCNLKRFNLVLVGFLMMALVAYWL